MFFGKFVFFFFSSRRRHTIYIGDWSSDVCSSDLGEVSVALRDRHRDAYLARAEQIAPHLESAGQHAWLDTLEVRSEERRVGKECRFRCELGHLERLINAS